MHLMRLLPFVGLALVTLSCASSNPKVVEEAASAPWQQWATAELFFSDDDRRVMVQLRSRVPLIGSLTMHLRTYRQGQAFAAWSAPR